jgi:hypothetical protein
MTGGNRSRDYRKLAARIACSGILLAALAAGSHWHRAAKTGAASPLATAFASNASAARPSSVVASDPLASFPLAQGPVAISHPAKRQPAPQSSTPELPSAPASSVTMSPLAPARAMKTFAALPMMFEANSGQTDARVKFLSHAPGYALFLTDNEAVLSLPSGSPGSASVNAAQDSKKSPGPQPDKSHTPRLTRIVRLKFAGGSTPTAITGRDQLPGKTNYFLGNDPKQWREDIANYEGVEYRGVYPGVDVVFHGNQQRLEYDFVVAAGADPHAIALDVEGAKRMRITPRGDVVLGVGQSELELEKPVVYQEVEGQRREVAGNFVLRGPHRIGFALGPYDRSLPLVIDPILVYSTYLGGSSFDEAFSVALDSSDNIYVTGYTSSTNFPTANAFQATKDGAGYDAFVTKLNAGGAALVYSTYLGGSSFDEASGIAVDSSGNAYVTGHTESTDFPTKNPLQAANAGLYDAFVTELNATGSLVYSTYLGGSSYDYGYAIAVDSSGNAYVTGSTQSTNFPTKDPLQAANGGGYDAFVAKLNFNASTSTLTLVYSTYLGGSLYDSGQGIAVDSSGNAYVAGSTQSINFPTQDPYQGALSAANGNVFVAKLNNTGSALDYSTYLGGSTGENGTGIAIDSSGNAYVTGYTQSSDFPVTGNAFQQTYGGDGDAFVTKLNQSGSSLDYSTYLGGSSYEYGYAITVDSSDNIYVTGYTGSTDFPITPNPFQQTYGGDGDAFVTKFNAAGALVYSTYLGGSGLEYGYGIAVDSSLPNANVYVAGATYSKNFPVTANAFQATNNASSATAFIAEISQNLTILPATIPTGTAGVPYSTVNFTAPNGQGTVNFAVTGSLPSGLTLLPAGVLSGTPTQTWNSPITITASDSETDTGSISLNLVISCPTITVGPNSLPVGTVGTAYSQQFTETGGIPPIMFNEMGLPAGIGMSFNSGGLLFGTPTTVETSVPITVTATDSNQCPGIPVTDALTINPSTTGTASDNEPIVVTDQETVTPLINFAGPAAWFSTSGLAFNGQSGILPITVSNVGRGSLVFSGAPAISSSSGSFIITQTVCSNLATSLPTTLPGGGACTLTISYMPSSNPTYDTGTIVFTDNAALSSPTSTLLSGSYTQTIALNGGVATTSTPPPPPATVTLPVDNEPIIVTDQETVTPLINFAGPAAWFSTSGLGFNGQSGIQPLTVSNVGGGSLVFSGAPAISSSSGSFIITQTVCSSLATSLPTTLPGGGACTLTISYMPSSNPTYDTGTIVFTDNAALSSPTSTLLSGSYTQTIALNGGVATTSTPPLPPATVTLPADNEPIIVTDTPSPE